MELEMNSIQDQNVNHTHTDTHAYSLLPSSIVNSTITDRFVTPIAAFMHHAFAFRGLSFTDSVKSASIESTHRSLIAILSSALFSSTLPLSSSARDPTARGDNAASSTLERKPWRSSAMDLRRCEAASLGSSARAFSASTRAYLAREVAAKALLDLLAWARSCAPWTKWRLAWTAQGFGGQWRRGKRSQKQNPR